MAAVAVGIAVWAALAALSPERSAGEQAVVAAGDLPAGHRLTAQDVRVAPVDPASAPRSRTTEPGSVVGQTLGQPVEAGEVFTAARLRPARGLAALPAGRRALHVPVLDAGAVGLVRPGDRVDVIAISAGQTVGSDLLVLSVDPEAESGSGLASGGRAGAGGVVLAATEQDVARIVPASAGGVADGVQLAVKSDK
ncbi:MAG: Flp pilus assembly protein CpaB [Micrococcales bacterium]|nr:Flp pilus assembly protein CpaB [Micrococcales bacterium]